MSAGGSDFATAFSHEAHYVESPVRKTIKLEMFEPPSNYRVDLNADPRCNECHVRTRELSALPASMQVQAYVLLDRRPLYEWILSPIYDLARTAH